MGNDSRMTIANSFSPIKVHNVIADTSNNGCSRSKISLCPLPPLCLGTHRMWSAVSTGDGEAQRIIKAESWEEAEALAQKQLAIEESGLCVSPS